MSIPAPLPTQAAAAGPPHQHRGHQTLFSFLPPRFSPQDLTFRRQFLGNPHNECLPPSVLSAGESYQAKKIDSLSEAAPEAARDLISLEGYYIQC